MHWRNSNFQIMAFIVSKCHTPDEAYRQLQQLREDRDVAIRNATASEKRAEAKTLRARYVIENAESYTPADVKLPCVNRFYSSRSPRNDEIASFVGERNTPASSRNCGGI